MDNGARSSQGQISLGTSLSLILIMDRQADVVKRFESSPLFTVSTCPLGKVVKVLPMYCGGKSVPFLSIFAVVSYRKQDYHLTSLQLPLHVRCFLTFFFLLGTMVSFAPGLIERFLSDFSELLIKH